MMNEALKAKATIKYKPKTTIKYKPKTAKLKKMFSQMKRRKRLQMKTFRPKTVVTMTSTTNNPKR